MHYMLIIIVINLIILDRGYKVLGHHFCRNHIVQTYTLYTFERKNMIKSNAFHPLKESKAASSNTS